MFVIEFFNKTTNQYKYLAHDAQSGGYPYFTNGLFMGTRFKTFEEARNEYQRLLSAPVVKMSDGTLSLPTVLRSAADINGRTVNSAVVEICILEVAGDTWPELKVTRSVNHTLQLNETKSDANIVVIKDSA